MIRSTYTWTINNFLKRLKSIIELSDMTMSNSIATHIGYCLYMNKPHYVDLSQSINRIQENNDRQAKLVMDNEKNSQKTFKDNENIIKLSELFSDFNCKITKEQQELVSYLWGFNEVKSPEELKKLFGEINKNFSWIKYYLSGLTRFKSIMVGER